VEESDGSTNDIEIGFCIYGKKRLVALKRDVVREMGSDEFQ